MSAATAHEPLLAQRHQVAPSRSKDARCGRALLACLVGLMRLFDLSAGL